MSDNEPTSVPAPTSATDATPSRGEKTAREETGRTGVSPPEKATKTGADDDAETSGANKASAEITGHLTLYALVPMGDTFYLKAGYAMTSIDTTETLATGTAYGNETVNGYTVGAGLSQDTDNGGFWRLEATYSDYEDADFNGTLLTEASASVRNKVNAELEAVAVRFSIGKQF